MRYKCIGCNCILLYVARRCTQIVIICKPNSWTDLNFIRLTPESLRWMILQKKMEPAKALVQKITKFNGLPYPTEQMDAINSHNKISTEAARQFSFFDLLQTREMRKRSLILFYLWQVNKNTSFCPVLIIVTRLPVDYCS